MNAVKKFRDACGLTQEQLAGELGVSGPLVNHYETGRNQITPNNAKKLVLICEKRGVKASLDEIYESLEQSKNEKSAA